MTLFHYKFALVLLLVVNSAALYSQKTKKPISILNLAKAEESLPEHRTCYTMVVDSIARAKNSSRGSLSLFESNMQKAIQKYKLSAANTRQSDLQEDTLIIPVIVHVIHNGQAIGTAENISAAQVYSQIDVLNEDYQRKIGTKGYNTSTVGAGLAIKFVKALVDADGIELDEPGIDRYDGGNVSWDSQDEIESILKPATQFDPDNYLNIWTVKFGGDMAQILGYAQFPNLSGLSGLSNNEGSAATDGVVIRYSTFGRVGNVSSPYNLGRTTTHEVGHFLGLRHIWGDNSNCTGTDYCDDTPPTDQAIYNCPSYYKSCINTAAMKENYMDYTNDGCMNIFTKDQKTRMLTVFNTSPARVALKNSKVYLPSSLPSANFTVSQSSSCLNNAVVFQGRSGKAPTFVKWEVYNLQNEKVSSYQGTTNAFTFTGTNTNVYSVLHITGNEFGYDTLFKKNVFNVLPSDNQSLPYSDDFENTSSLLSQLYIPNADSTWKLTNKASANGVGDYSIFYNNYDTTFDQSGTRSGFITSKFDFTSDTDAYLSFKLAYATYGNLYTNDSLAIYYTTDCGKTYTQLWKKGGDNMATAKPTPEFFIPDTSQWRMEQVSLRVLNGLTNVNFLFLNISGWANNLYLDNIQINTPLRTATPVSNFIINPLTVCPGGIVSFIDQSSQYPTSWQWTIATSTSGNLTSNLQNPQVAFDSPGKYSVSLTASNGLGKGTKIVKSQYIYVAANPTIAINNNSIYTNYVYEYREIDLSCGKNVTFTGTGGIDYFWYDNTSLNSLSQSNTLLIAPNQNTQYYYVVADNSFGCFNIDVVYTNLKDYCLTPIVNENNLENASFVVFPNPSNGNTTIQLSENMRINDKTTIEFKDLNGIARLSSTLPIGSSSEELNTSSLASGLYIIHIYSGSVHKYLKFVKQ